MEGGGLCSTKIELEPGEAEDGDLMTDAIINYSKYLIMVLHDAVSCTHSRTHRERTTVASSCVSIIVCRHNEHKRQNCCLAVGSFHPPVEFPSMSV